MECMDPDKAGAVLLNMDADQAAGILNGMDPSKVGDVLETMDPSAGAELLLAMDPQNAASALSTMDSAKALAVMPITCHHIVSPPLESPSQPLDARPELSSPACLQKMQGDYWLPWIQLRPVQHCLP